MFFKYSTKSGSRRDSRRVVDLLRFFARATHRGDGRFAGRSIFRISGGVERTRQERRVGLRTEEPACGNGVKPEAPKKYADS